MGLNKNLMYPKATAPATDSPIAADFPRPRAAVRATVLLRVFSDTASINFSTAFAYGMTRFLKITIQTFLSSIPFKFNFLLKPLCMFRSLPSRLSPPALLKVT